MRTLGLSVAAALLLASCAITPATPDGPATSVAGPGGDIVAGFRAFAGDPGVEYGAWWSGSVALSGTTIDLSGGFETKDGDVSWVSGSSAGPGRWFVQIGDEAWVLDRSRGGWVETPDRVRAADHLLGAWAALELHYAGPTTYAGRDLHRLDFEAPPDSLALLLPDGFDPVPTVSTLYVDDEGLPAWVRIELAIDLPGEADGSVGLNYQLTPNGVPGGVLKPEP
jgi:hypothetical protein